ncbi:hypothetical protein RFI_36496, partial [Reticulomyxa filosa]
EHYGEVLSIKYGSNELGNTILSGSCDSSVRLLDIRSNTQIQEFNGHSRSVYAVEYTPFVANNSTPNVVCSASYDDTIRFWDIRSNKQALYMINTDFEKDYGICSLKVLSLKDKNKKKEN